MNKKRQSLLMLIVTIMILFIVGCSNGNSSTETKNSATASSQNLQDGDSTGGTPDLPYMDGNYPLYGVSEGFRMGPMLRERIQQYLNVGTSPSVQGSQGFEIENNIKPDYFNAPEESYTYRVKYNLDKSGLNGVADVVALTKVNGALTSPPGVDTGYIESGEIQDFQTIPKQKGRGILRVDMFSQSPTWLRGTTDFNPDSESSMLQKYPTDLMIFNHFLNYASESDYTFRGTLELGYETIETNGRLASIITSYLVMLPDGSAVPLMASVLPNGKLRITATPNGQEPSIVNADGSPSAAKILAFQNGVLTVQGPTGEVDSMDYGSLCSPTSTVMIIPQLVPPANRKLLKGALDNSSSYLGDYRLTCTELAQEVIPTGEWQHKCNLIGWDGTTLSTMCKYGDGFAYESQNIDPKTCPSSDYDVVNGVPECVQQHVTKVATIDTKNVDCDLGLESNGIQAVNCRNSDKGRYTYPINIKNICEDSGYKDLLSTSGTYDTGSRSTSIARCASYNQTVNAATSIIFQQTCTITDFEHEPAPEQSLLSGYCIGGRNSYIPFEVYSLVQTNPEDPVKFCPDGQSLINKSGVPTCQVLDSLTDVNSESLVDLMDSEAISNCGDFDYRTAGNAKYVTATCNNWPKLIRATIDVSSCNGYSLSYASIAIPGSNQSLGGLVCAKSDFSNQKLPGPEMNIFFSDGLTANNLIQAADRNTLYPNYLAAIQLMLNQDSGVTKGNVINKISAESRRAQFIKGVILDDGKNSGCDPQNFGIYPYLMDVPAFDKECGTLYGPPLFFENNY